MTQLRRLPAWPRGLTLRRRRHMMPKTAEMMKLTIHHWIGGSTIEKDWQMKKKTILIWASGQYRPHWLRFMSCYFLANIVDLEWSHVNLHMLWRNQPRYSFHSGSASLLLVLFLVVWCPTMYQLVGTQHTTCSTSHLTSGLQLIRWLQCATLTSKNTSYLLQNGVLQRSLGMSWMCVHLQFFISHFKYPSQIFKDATLFFSCGTPNLSTVIPAMDHIDKVLATTSDSHQFSLSIHAALVIGKNWWG